MLCEQMLGRRPARVQLYYLSRPEAIIAVPTEQTVNGVTMRTTALWSAIAGAAARDDFRPSPVACATSARSSRTAPPTAAIPCRRAGAAGAGRRHRAARCPCSSRYPSAAEPPGIAPPAAPVTSPDGGRAGDVGPDRAPTPPGAEARPARTPPIGRAGHRSPTVRSPTPRPRPVLLRALERRRPRAPLARARLGPRRAQGRPGYRAASSARCSARSRSSPTA